METVSSGLKELDGVLSGLLKDAPDLRRELHEKLGALAKQELDSAISGSGVRDAHRAVRRWQVVHIGSKGGYAAVRPAGSSEGGGVGPESAGAVTTYLEDGHKIRTARARVKGYRPRIRVAFVSGYHFYERASASFEAKAIREAERFTDMLRGRLEGGG